MAIADHFRPKWKNSDPDVRLMAIRGLKDPEILTDIISADKNFRVRLAAVGKISDQSLLGRIASEDQHVQVRLAAIKNIQNPHVLFSLASKNKEEKVRMAALSLLDSEQMLEVLATDNDNINVRVAAVRRIEDQSILVRLVEMGRCRPVRLAALQRINDFNALAEVATRERNLQIRLAAVERLRSMPRKAGGERTRALATPFQAVEAVEGPWLLEPYFQSLSKIENQRVRVDIARSRAHHLLRWEAVTELDDQDILADLARHDPHEKVRAAAARRMVDQQLLFGIACSDEHYRVRMAAALGLAQSPGLAILCESDSDVRVRLAALSRMDDPALLEHVTEYNSHPLVRLAARKKRIKKPLVEQIHRVYITAFLNGRRITSRTLPATDMSMADLRPALDPACMAVLAKWDDRQGFARASTSFDTNDLFEIALYADSILARVAAVEQLHAPSVLLELLQRCKAICDDPTATRGPGLDFVRWTILEKLGSPRMCKWAGFDRDYVKTLTDEELLMTILATDVFEDMRIIAENRYFSILTIGTRAHVQYGDANMYG